MRKRISAAVLALLVVMAMAPMKSSAGTTNYDKENPIVYPVENGNIYIARDGTLYDCDESVTKAVIPEEVEGIPVTSIHRLAFSRCDKLTSLTFNSAINDISTDKRTISGKVLTEVVIPEENENFCFEDDILFSKDHKILYGATAASTMTTYTVPETVEKIVSCAFEDLQYLEEADLSRCKAASLSYTFKNCVNLKKVKLSSYTDILSLTFYGCRKLTDVEMGEHIRIIGQAFVLCSELSDIELPDSLEQIGKYTFQDCISLTSITIPKGVNFIDSGAFNYCYNLKEIHVEEGNERYYDIDGVLCSAREKALVCYPGGVKADYFEIPEGIEKIKAGAFPYYKLIINNLIIGPDLLTTEADSLYNAIYQGCAERIVYKDGAESLSGGIINIMTWWDGTVVIPESVTEIDTSLFPSDFEKKASKLTIECASGSFAEEFFSETFPDITVIIGGKRAQAIQCEDTWNVKNGCEPFKLWASAKTDLTYSSSDDTVASVSGDGIVTVKRTGDVTITITAAEDGIYSGDEKTIAVHIDKGNPVAQTIMGIAGEYELEVGSQLKLSPSAKTDITFMCVGDAVTVDSKGTVRAVREGSAKVLVTAVENDDFLKSMVEVEFVVKKRAEESTPTKNTAVTKQKQEISCSKGSINQKYSKTPISLGCKANTALTYASSNAKVVTVSQDGAATLKGAGDAVITVKAAETSRYYGASRTIKVHVTKADQSISCSSAYKKKCGEAFQLGASAKTSLTYKSSNSKIAKVDSTGKVNVKGIGNAYITITAKATSQYGSASKKVTIQSDLKKPKLTCVAKAGHKIKITWSKVPGAKGYKLYLYDADAKKYVCVLTKPAAIKSVTHRGLTKGSVYKYKVRAYGKADGKTAYSAYSAVKKVKAK